MFCFVLFQVWPRSWQIHRSPCRVRTRCKFWRKFPILRELCTAISRGKCEWKFFDIWKKHDSLFWPFWWKKLQCCLYLVLDCFICSWQFQRKRKVIVDWEMVIELSVTDIVATRNFLSHFHFQLETLSLGEPLEVDSKPSSKSYYKWAAFISFCVYVFSFLLIHFFSFQFFLFASIARLK